MSVVFTVMEFDEPQTFGTLLSHLRERHHRLAAIKALIEAETLAQEAFSQSE